jgi:hypothetical protein
MESEIIYILLNIHHTENVSNEICNLHKMCSLYHPPIVCPISCSRENRQRSIWVSCKVRTKIKLTRQFVVYNTNCCQNPFSSSERTHLDGQEATLCVPSMHFAQKRVAIVLEWRPRVWMIHRHEKGKISTLDFYLFISIGFIAIWLIDSLLFLFLESFNFRMFQF